MLKLLLSKLLHYSRCIVAFNVLYVKNVLVACDLINSNLIRVHPVRCYEAIILTHKQLKTAEHCKDFTNEANKLLNSVKMSTNGLCVLRILA